MFAKTVDISNNAVLHWHQNAAMIPNMLLKTHHPTNTVGSPTRTEIGIDDEVSLAIRSCPRGQNRVVQPTRGSTHLNPSLRRLTTGVEHSPESSRIDPSDEGTYNAQAQRENSQRVRWTVSGNRHYLI